MDDRPAQFKAAILVIDADPDLRDGLCVILELDDYQVVSAETGAEGLRLLRQQPPDLIICAFSLPDIRGDKMLEMLQSDPVTASIPVLWSVSTSRHRDPSGQTYLIRPWDADEMLALVARMLK